MSNPWFAVQLDRDFITHGYGMGIYYYEKNKPRVIIEGISYDGNILKVKSNNIEINIDSEPDIDFYRNSLYKDWEEWNDKYGVNYGDDDVDFIPWCLKTKKALAIELNLIKNSENESLYIKK